jgi:hypothetical protein
VAQGVGLEESDYPRGSEEAVSRSESAPQRDAAANDYLPLAEEESKGTVQRRSGGSRGRSQAPTGEWDEPRRPGLPSRGV